MRHRSFGLRGLSCFRIRLRRRGRVRHRLIGAIGNGGTFEDRTGRVCRAVDRRPRLAVVVDFLHPRIRFATFMTTVSGHQAIIVFGMLKIAFRPNSVTGRGCVTGECQILFDDLLGVASYLDLRTVAFERLRPWIRILAAISPAKSLWIGSLSHRSHFSVQLVTFPFAIEDYPHHQISCGPLLVSSADDFGSG